MLSHKQSYFFFHSGSSVKYSGNSAGTNNHNTVAKLCKHIKVFSDTHEEVNLSEDEDDVRPASEGGESEADDGFDTQSIMSAAPGSDEATESDDFGDFDLTSFPELDDLDISDGSGDAGTSLDDLDIDI